MRHARHLGLVLAIACALTAITAGTASAASEFYWHDTGETIKTTEPAVGSAQGSVVLSGTLFGIKTTITCKATISGSLDNFAASGTQGHITEGTQLWTGCTSNIGCSVFSEGQPVGTVHLTSLTGLAEGGSTRFSNEAGGALGQIILGSPSCLVPGIYELSGFIKGSVENVKGHLTFNSISGSSVSLAGAPAAFTATFKQTATGRQFDQK